jgi:hypothetical protein
MKKKDFVFLALIIICVIAYFALVPEGEIQKLDRMGLEGLNLALFRPFLVVAMVIVLIKFVSGICRIRTEWPYSLVSAAVFGLLSVHVYPLVSGVFWLPDKMTFLWLMAMLTGVYLLRIGVASRSYITTTVGHVFTFAFTLLHAAALFVGAAFILRGEMATKRIFPAELTGIIRTTEILQLLFAVLLVAGGATAMVHYNKLMKKVFE